MYSEQALFQVAQLDNRAAKELANELRNFDRSQWIIAPKADEGFHSMALFYFLALVMVDYKLLLNIWQTN